MTEGLKGVTLTYDNYFTFFSLAQELLRKKVALVGNISANKPEELLFYVLVTFYISPLIKNFCC